MDNTPQHDETHFVRCLKCLKILKCSRYDTSTLLEHIRTDHPEIEIVESSAPHRQQRQNGGGTAATQTIEGGRITHQPGTPVQMSSDTPNMMYTGSLNINANPNPNAQQHTGGTSRNADDDEETIYNRCQRRPASPSLSNHAPRQRWLYRTSIEKWRPATGTLYCPKCGANKRPLIKTRTERLSGNTCGAACLLGCWPFCFLPFLCSGEDKEYLHCSNCKSFLGLYDRNHNCVRPNREFIESQENVRDANRGDGEE